MANINCRFYKANNFIFGCSLPVIPNVGEVYHRHRNGHVSEDYIILKRDFYGTETTEDETVIEVDLTVSQL